MVTIYHNPACGTSRHALKIIEAAGYQPHIILYLETGWTQDQLVRLFAAAGLTPRQALRAQEDQARGLDLNDDATLLAAMVAHPRLVNRPFVETPRGTRLCRPSAIVLDLLDRWPPGPFPDKDGSPLIDATGARVT